MQQLQDSRIFVQSSGANILAAEVRQQLEKSGITTVKSASEAEYVIKLNNENFGRSILSVSSTTGKVEEYEITYRANLSITGADGESLVKSVPITAARDYTFNEDAVLSKFTEENVLRRDIAKYAAASVLRRLRAVTK